jgi:hypothetical protein
MFVRVREFGTARREMFPVASSAGKLFAAVAAAAEGLEQQLSSNPGGRGTPREGSLTMPSSSESVEGGTARTTRNLTPSLDAPDIADKFRSLNCGDDERCRRARAFAASSRPFAKLFIAHDMPSNFLSALAEIDAL